VIEKNSPISCEDIYIYIPSCATEVHSIITRHARLHTQTTSLNDDVNFIRNNSIGMMICLSKIREVKTPRSDRILS